MKKELSKDMFIDAGYEVESLSDKIWLIKEFLTKEEQQGIFEIINGLTQYDWEQFYISNLKTFCMEKFGRDDVDNLVAEGKFEVTDNWKDKAYPFYTHNLSKQITHRLQQIFKEHDDLNVNGAGIIQRQYEGVPLKAHSDQHTDPSIVAAGVIYINDDYTDGEVFFENKGIKLKPPARSLLIFPGDAEHTHGVDAPGAGPIRYVSPCFIHIKDFYKDNKY